MARVKRGTTAHKRRKKVLSATKGYRWGRKTKYKLAKDALRHAWQYSFRDRKTKKRTFRSLWQIQIGAASKTQGISYSKLISLLKKHNIQIDRKILAVLTKEQPQIFEEILKKVKE